MSAPQGRERKQQQQRQQQSEDDASSSAATRSAIVSRDDAEHVAEGPGGPVSFADVFEPDSFVTTDELGAPSFRSYGGEDTYADDDELPTQDEVFRSLKCLALSSSPHSYPAPSLHDDDVFGVHGGLDAGAGAGPCADPHAKGDFGLHLGLGLDGLGMGLGGLGKPSLRSGGGADDRRVQYSDDDSDDEDNLITGGHAAAASVLSSSLDSSRAEPPKPAFGYLEPRHTVYSQEKPGRLFPFCADYFNVQPSMDCVVRESDFALDCLHYANGEELSFVVSLLTIVSCSRYAIEVQRRKGCAFAFAAIFREFVQALSSRDLLEPSSLPKKRLAPLGPPPPLTACMGMGVSVAETKEKLQMSREVVRKVSQMASSRYLDCKCEGVGQLMRLSHDSSLHNVLLEEGAWDVLVKSLSCDCEDVYRCALTALANIAQAPATRNGVVSFVQEGHLSRVYAHLRSPKFQVCREAARLLANVAMLLRGDLCDISDGGSLSEALQGLRMHPDSAVRKHADVIQTWTSMQT